MADIQITDEASLEAWLKTRPRRDAEIIAFRAAARVFPLWGRAMEEPWALYAAQKRKGDLTAIPILRFLLTLSILDHPNTVNFQKKISQSISETTSTVEATSSHYAAASAASAALKSIDKAIGTKTVLKFASDSEAFASAIDDFLEATRYSSPSLWRIVKKDAITAAGKKAGFVMPLWPTPAPNWFNQADRETRAIWRKDPPTWAFWEKWWDGVISGDMPFAEGLLRDVALIEDDVWQAGPKAVGEAIARIEKIHDLRAQLAALTRAMEDGDLSQVQQGATIAHRGHNNPPEMIEAIAIVQTSAVDIAQALDEAREELAKPAPEPSRLKAIGTGMLSALRNAAGYCGGLADKFLQEFAGEMGKQAATVVAWLIKGGIGVSLLTAFAKSMIAIWPF